MPGTASLDRLCGAGWVCRCCRCFRPKRKGRSGRQWPKTRDPDPVPPNRHDSPLLQIGAVARKDQVHQPDPLLDKDIWQAHEAAVRLAVEEEKLAEILVHAHKDTAFGRSAFKERPVSWIGTPIRGCNDIVSLGAEPFRQASACTTIDEEFQRLATRIASRDSSAMTACA